MVFENLDFKVGSVNPSGLGLNVFYAPKSYIKSFPSITYPDEDDATPSEVAAYSGDFVMATDKKFMRFYSTQGKGSATAEATGETDCKMFLNKLTLAYPKLNAQAKAFASATANGDFVFVVSHDGGYIIIGDPEYRSSITSNLATGDAAGSTKGLTVNVECPCVIALPSYSGKIELEEGSFDCATGAITTGE